MLQTTTLTPHALTTTRLGFGCASLMRIPQRRQRLRSLELSYEYGVRHFDVAPAYGLGVAEADLGRFAKGRRESVTIATKFGLEISPLGRRLARVQAPARALMKKYPQLRAKARATSHQVQGSRRYTAAQARQSLEQSLRQLQTDYVDLLLVHDPGSVRDVELEPLAEYLEAARVAGLVRAWGFAGDARVCSALRAETRQATLLQARRDFFSESRSASMFGQDPMIVFGVLSEALPRVASQLETLQATLDGEHQDLASREVLGPVLILDALESGPDDVVLFSTTSDEHLRRIMDAVTGDGQQRSRQQLAGLRQLIRSEVSDA